MILFISLFSIFVAEARPLDSEVVVGLLCRSCCLGTGDLCAHARELVVVGRPVAVRGRPRSRVDAALLKLVLGQLCIVSYRLQHLLLKLGHSQHLLALELILNLEFVQHLLGILPEGLCGQTWW